MQYKRLLKSVSVIFILAVLLAAAGCDKAPPMVQLHGQVLDMANDLPIEGARVQAVDINGAPVGNTAATDAQGNYELTVPHQWNPDGDQEKETEESELEYGVYMLHCQAMGYQAFPSSIRPSLPIDMETAVKAAPGEETLFAKLTIDETTTILTTIKLIALGGASDQLGIISGHIALPKDSDDYAGVLVVAVNEGNQVAYTGLSGLDGDYAVFNVPAGTYRVEAYTQGLQFKPETGVVLEAGEEHANVDLSQSDRPLNSVGGSVQIVNAPGGSVTSVILALESTFDEIAVRGTMPPGLRAGDVTGAFLIEDIPDGRYVVLAAYENDGLVRDPDESISGTDIVHIEVPGAGGANDVEITDGFKITEALAIVQPGASGTEAVSSLTPVLEWADDSSEEGYEIQVLDSFGTRVWETEVDGVSGSETVSLVYAGPALDESMYYQFRVVSFRDGKHGRSYISATEDLKGVFYFGTTEQ
ncbi:MAG: carboxypeptidase regulatory-like domain-containing protein [Candidatus Hydrogenedentes bacterium]|nr:carboxypeptidase regulatory-like domain-containing protein [Candidatus Hydrogenedentota bacterium]